MKNQNGITLIALIITIIVMLILVAVTVTIVVQSGLFGHAQNAAEGYKNAQKVEEDIDNRFTANDNGTTITGVNNIVDHYVNSNP